MFRTGRKEEFLVFFYINFMVLGSGVIKVERSHILITERD